MIDIPESYKGTYVRVKTRFRELDSVVIKDVELCGCITFIGRAMIVLKVHSPLDITSYPEEVEQEIRNRFIRNHMVIYLPKSLIDDIEQCQEQTPGDIYGGFIGG